jgi:rod shape-determining protein MreD
MRLTFAAIGAVVAAILQLSLVPYLAIGKGEPDLLLVAAVIATIVGSVESGLTWAFVGGLVIDCLAPRPVGLTAFTLLVCVGLAGAFGRLVGRGRAVTPIIAVFALSFVNSLFFLVMYGALRARITSPDPLDAIVPGAVFSTVIAAVVAPVAVRFRMRAAERERVAW